MEQRHPFAALLGANRTIPVVTFQDVADAVPVGEALLEGGVSVIEVTLRTPAGLEALRALAAACPGLTLGAGTVLDSAQADDAVAAGARFLVSPGHTARLVSAALDRETPWMLGATTLSEVMALREAGFRVMKFFPAEPMGGIATLKAIGAVLPDVTFCPTGGISSERARSYLDLGNVIAVGGSWFVAGGRPDRAAIQAAAAQAVAMLPVRSAA